MNKKNELIKNTLILALGKVFTQLMSFLLLPLYTIFLSPSDYGTVDLVTTYIVLFAPVITLQLEMAAFRHLIDARDNEQEKTKVISSTLRISGLLLIIFTILYILLGRFVNIPYSNLILFSIYATVFSNLFLQFARGLGKNKNFAVGSIMAGIVTVLSNIISIVVLHMGARGMLTSIVLANIVCSLYLFLSLKLYKYVDIKSSSKQLRSKLIKYSIPLVPNGVSWWVITVSDRTIVSIAISVAANGIYAVANKYAAIFTSIFSIFNMSWVESASVHINDTDRDEFFSETINASIRFFGSLGLILIAFIPLIFNFLINIKYNEAYQYIPILILAAFFNASVGLYGSIYVAKKMTKQVANTTIVAAIVNIALNLIFIKFIGVYAAAISTAVAYLTVFIYRHYDVKKYVKITYEKNIFINMAVLYTFAMVLYYYNNIFGNIANAIIITIIVILLNKSIVKVIKDKVLSLNGRRRPKLTIEQEIYEDSL